MPTICCPRATSSLLSRPRRTRPTPTSFIAAGVGPIFEGRALYATDDPLPLDADPFHALLSTGSPGITSLCVRRRAVESHGRVRRDAGDAGRLGLLAPSRRGRSDVPRCSRAAVHRPPPSVEHVRCRPEADWPSRDCRSSSAISPLIAPARNARTRAGSMSGVAWPSAHPCGTWRHACPCRADLGGGWEPCSPFSARRDWVRRRGANSARALQRNPVE